MTAKRYETFTQLNLPEISRSYLETWKQDDTFKKSISTREGQPSFVFYEGPPSANGMPGIHHVISRTLKDLVCRYKTMQGFEVKRKGGWDTHGLPVELGVEKELGITKEDIGVKISVEDYNKKCREVVMRYKDKWDEITQKMGYWVDLENPYVTFNNDYIETLWWCLSELYKKGYLYESVSIQPYSPAAGTGLSSHELNQPGTYKDVKDTSAVAMFKINEAENTRFLFEAAAKEEFVAVNEKADLFFMAWTTTPWTLPSNLGLTVGANIEYVLVKTFNPYTFQPVFVILAKALVNKYFKAEAENTNFETFETADKLIPWKIVTSCTGAELEGITYEQLMPYPGNNLEVIQEITPGAEPFKVIIGDFVTTEDGTGIVHTSPAFGADDYKVGKKNNLGILTLVDKEGKFVENLGDISGRFVKNYKDDKEYVDVNVDISVQLKKENRAFKVEKYEHNYPHCWRTDKPIIYYPLDAWFIKTTAAKDRMVELNKTINWKPASTGTGRFGNWLENMVDWNLSRSRFWGTPLPIWKTLAHFNPFVERDLEDLGEYDEVCVGSKNNLISCSSKSGWEVEGYYIDFKKLTLDLKNKEEKISLAINDYNEKLEGVMQSFSIDLVELNRIAQLRDLNKNDIRDAIIPINILKDYSKKIDVELSVDIDFHKPDIDNIIFVRKEDSGKDYIYIRVDDLIDVWFDSGAMPYAQWHFPFENKETFEKNFPADFICEGVDQTRGWFYTLHALAVLLFDSVAYKNVVSNGLVLDKAGNKMSKRLGNVVDPFITIDNYGADATRWYLITNASPWDSLKFDEAGIKEAQRKFFGTIFNTYQFFALYANVDGFKFSEAYIPVHKRPEIDQWILSSLNSLIKTVTENLDTYEPTQAGRAMEEFVDTQLSNWYVRLCRRRFWKGEYEHDKICAYQTLYECLETLAQLMAPIAPFFADWLFTNLNKVTENHEVTSVHLSYYPKVQESVIFPALEKRMQLAQDVCSLILSLRKKVNIKVRQPLQKVFIPALDAHTREEIKQVEDIIKAETNIKEIEIIAADNDFIRKKAKANFKTLGKRLGTQMKWAAGIITAFDNATIEKVLQGPFILNTAEVESGAEPITITEEDLEIATDDIPGFEIAAKGPLTVALDINITDNLKSEGVAREFVNKLQNLRKDSGLDVMDRIDLRISENVAIQKSLIEYKDYICGEILADTFEFDALENGTQIDINEEVILVTINKKIK